MLAHREFHIALAVITAITAAAIGFVSQRLARSARTLKGREEERDNRMRREKFMASSIG